MFNRKLTLERAIYGPVKHECANESNTSTENAKEQRNHAHVGQVYNHRQDTDQIQATGQEPEAV